MAADDGVFAGVLADDLAGDLAGVLADVLAGVLESCCSTAAPVKLSSLIGDTEDLLFVSDFRAEAAERLVVEARFLLVEAVVRFLIGVGVVFALGRGVPLIGLEARLAGVVEVCFAILDQSCGCKFMYVGKGKGCILIQDIVLPLVVNKVLIEMMLKSMK